RTIAHRLIEEFMLAANEAVARFIDEHRLPFLYRVHELPDAAKLQDFDEFVRSLGHELRLEEGKVEPGEFQRLLASVEGKPGERLVNQLLLRCMKQARYAAENLGHFGLASASYTHFTSPIRRYPDLVVHRILKSVLGGTLSPKRVEWLERTLPEIAEQTSQRERVAMEAEREIVTLKKVQFMADKVGEEFHGFITGVTPSGFFVELADVFVEGMVHVTALPPDFYLFQEKEHLLIAQGSRKSYRLGDRVDVRVANVSIARREIDFVLAGYTPPFASAPPEEYPRIPVKGKPVPHRGKTKSHGPQRQGTKPGRSGGRRRRR
ncbi:MAG TPA: RNB domain-containing ribonuclease, partial [Geobacteraceae bacterium]